MSRATMKGKAMRGLAVLALTLLAAPAFAASGAALPFTFKADTANLPSVQRGASNYMNYCAGCHSLKYLRYNRIGRDLEIPEALLQKHLMFTSDKPGDVIKVAMPVESEQWFGRIPPDLSLTARERGPDWVYSYLMTFYLDPGKPSGVNNLVLPGASMPHVLGELQGYQRLAAAADGASEGGHHKPALELATQGSLSPADYKAFVGDLTNFMVYAAEPGRNRRMSMGVGVLAFIALFWFLAYLLKTEYFKDVH